MPPVCHYETPTHIRRQVFLQLLLRRHLPPRRIRHFWLAICSPACEQGFSVSLCVSLVGLGTSMIMKSSSASEWALCAVCGCIPFMLLFRPRWLLLRCPWCPGLLYVQSTGLLPRPVCWTCRSRTATASHHLIPLTVLPSLPVSIQLHS